jgi:DNA-directed RNA polymerase specialized sigma24 family protein
MIPDRQPPGQFPPTEWELVLAAAAKSDRPTECLQIDRALNELCSMYRGPIVEFCRVQLRRRDAEDIAQEFLAEMARGAFLARVDRSKGKFRTVLLAELKRFVFDLLDREKAAKRGGDVEFEPLPDDLGAGYLKDEQGVSADVYFDRAWAVVLANRGLSRLQEAFSKRKKLNVFECLRPFLISKVTGPDAEHAARVLGTSVEKLHVPVLRFRKEYGQLLRQEVARTVDAPHQIQSELRYLIELVAQSKWSS